MWLAENLMYSNWQSKNSFAEKWVRCQQWISLSGMFTIYGEIVWASDRKIAAVGKLKRRKFGKSLVYFPAHDCLENYFPPPDCLLELKLSSISLNFQYKDGKDGYKMQKITVWRIYIYSKYCFTDVEESNLIFLNN